MSSFYDDIGGMATIKAIVDRFYEGVAADEVLRPMYPEEDLGPAAERLTLFLAQYWGGPTTYSENRGHPRLRMRHVPYRIGFAERDAWLAHMRDGLDEVTLPPDLDAQFWGYLTTAADSLVNDPAANPDNPAPADPGTQTLPIVG